MFKVPIHTGYSYSTRYSYFTFYVGTKAVQDIQAVPGTSAARRTLQNNTVHSVLGIHTVQGSHSEQSIHVVHGIYSAQSIHTLHGTHEAQVIRTSQGIHIVY